MSDELPQGFELQPFASDQSVTVSSTPDPVPVESDPHALPPGFMLQAPASSHPVADGSQGDMLTNAGRIANTVVANAGAALGSTPRAIAHGVDWLAGVVGYHPGLDESLAGVQQKDLFGSQAHAPDRQVFPDYNTMRDAIFEGDENGPVTEFKPSSRLGQMGMSGATAGLLSLLEGPRAVLGGIGGGMTADEAAHLFPEHPYLSSFLGYTLGSKAANNVANTAQKTAAATVGGGTTDPYGAFQRLGLPTNMSGTVTGSPTLRSVENAVGAAPAGGGRAVVDGRENLLRAWADKVDETAANMSPNNVKTQQDLGTSLQAAANKWTQDFTTEAGKRYNAFFNAVPPGTQMKVSNYDAALQKALGNFQGAPATGQVLQPPTIQRLSTALQADLGPGGTTLSLDAIKNIRTQVGERLANPGSLPDTSIQALNTLYRGLTTDLEAGAAAQGSAASTLFRNANDFYRQGSGIRNDIVDPIVNAATPEQAAGWAMAQARQGGTRVQGIIDAMPQVKGDVGAYALRMMAGKDADNPSAIALGANYRRGALSPDAHSAIFDTPPPGSNLNTQQVAQDLRTTAARLEQIERAVRNGGANEHSVQIPGWMRAAEGAKLGHEAFGVPGAVAGGVAGAFAPSLSKLGKFALNPFVSGIAGRDVPALQTSPLLSGGLFAPAIGQDQ